MHALYERKKALFIVALCCMNSVGSFISATKDLPTENISENYTVPALEELPEKIQTIVKGKEKEYGKLLAYYEYKLSWSRFYMSIGGLLLFTAFEILLLYGIINTIIDKGLDYLKSKKLLIPSLGVSILLLCMVFLYVLGSIVNYKGAKYPGAIFLTDRGILFIGGGYNVKHEFIPYADIKQFKFQKLTGVLKIEFFKNFSDYERKGVEYSGKVNKISIKPNHMQNEAKGTNAYKDLHKKLSERVEKVRIEVIGEKAKQEST